MNPYGSGQQQNQPPRAPFGVGFWTNTNPSPYPSQQPPPPSQSTPYPSSGGGYPYNTNQTSAPYPTSYPSAQGSPYPSHTPQNPPYPSAAYPSAQQAAPYPSTQNHSPYPPITHNNSSYPGANNTPYPSGQPAYGGGANNQQWCQQTQSAYSCSTQPTNSYPHNSSPYPSSTQQQYPYSNLGQGYSQQTNNAYPGANNMTAQSYQSTVKKGTPTVTPAAGFDAVKDAHALRKAMKGFGTDEDGLINIICRRTNEQRQEIQRQYKTNFGKDLIEDIKSETSGNFENLLVGLLRPIVDFYCTELNAAMAGIGTDEEVLIEILCTLSNSEIHIIKNAYLRMFGAHLESELKSETSGNFKRLLVSLCAAARDESGRVDPVAAQHDARELLNAGELRVGTDESMFNMVLCQRNYQQLKLILDEYANITGHSLEKAIKREFSGDIQEGLLAICKCVTNKTEYFASRLHKSMAGFGTNDQQLIRIIITRSEIDLQDIKATFERVYGKSLKSWIKGDTSGHYKHALYALIGEQRSS